MILLEKARSFMSKDFRVIKIQVDRASLKRLSNRRRNQLIGCMHAHNELAVMNRILLFSLNDVGSGELHDHAQGVQMWCVFQILTGKLFETWNMLVDRFLSANPTDDAIRSLGADQQQSLAWLNDYFGNDEPNPTPLRTVRDKTAFHYDKLNLTEAIENLDSTEARVYLAQHPANGLYYVGSSLVFSAVFAMIADAAGDTAGMSQPQRMAEGGKRTLADLNKTNLHLHNVLYGLIRFLLEAAMETQLAQVSRDQIKVLDAPDPGTIALPMFLNLGQ